MAHEETLMIGVEAMQPGMVLAEDACDARGRMLVPSGTRLTQRHQRQMRLWGVELVTVVASMPALPQVTLPSEDAPVRIGEWLQIDERDPFMHELARQARAIYDRHQRAATRKKEGIRR